MSLADYACNNVSVVLIRAALPCMRQIDSVVLGYMCLHVTLSLSASVA